MSDKPLLFDNDKVSKLVKEYQEHGMDDISLLGEILSETRVLIEVIASKCDREYILRDDLIQEARLKLIRSLPEYDSSREKKLYSYFSVVIRNAMIDYIRKQKPSVELDDMEEESELSEGNYVILIVDELRGWFKSRFPTLIKKGLEGAILEIIITAMIDKHKKRKILKDLCDNYGFTYSQAKVVYEAVLVKLRTLMKKPSFTHDVSEQSLQPELLDIVGKDGYTDVNEAFLGLSLKFEEK